MHASCRDILKIILEAIKYDFFNEVVNTYVYKYQTKNKFKNLKFSWQNTNSLLLCPQFKYYGIKTGYFYFINGLTYVK
jgi:D-alanyl-D-alanine carboxypeptidase